MVKSMADDVTMLSGSLITMVYWYINWFRKQPLPMVDFLNFGDENFIRFICGS